MKLSKWFSLLMVLTYCLALCAKGLSQGHPESGKWKQLAKLTESSGKESDWLGWSVAISKDGNTAAVGAVGWCPLQNEDGCGQGAIFVFVKPPNGWSDLTETAMLTASDGQPGEYLGESVAISDDGSTIVAGAPLWPANGLGNGALYVFVKPQSGWARATETARLTATNSDGADLGDSVGISGHTIVGGGKYFNGGEGAAYVFVEPDTGWRNMTQRARLTPSDGKGAYMGWSLSVDGDTVVAGAPETGVGGEGNGAYVFVKPKGSWESETENAKLTASSGTGFRLGYSVSIAGDTIALGAPRKSTNNGAVFMYVKPAGGWRSASETARLAVPPKLNSLGYSVWIDNDEKNVISGAPGWQDGGGQGAIDLFTRPSVGWKTTSTPNATIVASDGRNGDNLGFSVSATADVVVSGAPDATVNSNLEEGAAYIFGR